MKGLKRLRDDDDDHHHDDDDDDTNAVDENVNANVKAGKEKKPKKAKKDEFLNADSYDEDEIKNLGAPALKEILKAHNLSSTGTKVELIERILYSIPYEPIAKSFEWDSTTGKLQYYLSKAKTSKSKCVRCLTLIDQGRNIVLKDTWDPIRRHNIDRKYHIECFCKYPCQGIESFKDIRWDDQQNNKTLIPVAEKLFNDFHRPNQAMPLRETPAAHIGLREQSNDLKREGYTGQQAMKKLENQIE